ncbi:sensor histidine kinase [Streptomyces sp. H39-S7]|uniref:sensor histidine kinase n=1 Tax=Streptomyces sp. H39-S7 TaxID=3004357 RepID=UPI0022AFD9CE|nr:sensor histidine kinase [Streptomyces sp. H39-S7]MCZ4118333.1 sensor histidine kinase [Streptomyces sp. H39-S7]
MTERLGTVLRRVPRALREDLWTGADPLPRPGLPHWLDWRPAITVPLLFVAVGMFIASANEYAVYYGAVRPISLLLAGIQAAALVAVLFRPVPAWWASTIATTVAAAQADVAASTLFPWTGAGLVQQSLMLFLLALRVRPRVAAEALVISLLAGLLCTASVSTGGLTNVVRLGALAFTTTTALGAALRGLGVARRKLVVQEELTAEERARRTLLEERNRIARELHDVVAHHMSVISIQAQVAPHLVENPSEELRETLAGIRANAVDALTELRHVLGVLRSEDALPDSTRHTPQPTLDRLDELVANVRGTGLPVTVRTTGEPRPLPPGVELSAFRIVQEALSNAMRHAPGAAVLVEVGHHASGVRVRVTNAAPDRAGPPSRGAGHGLLGMRERAVMLGGELATGPTPDGGYEVTAILPARPPVPPADPAEDTP